MWPKKDLKWLKQNYPALTQVSDKVIEGRLSFQMLFADGKNYINPKSRIITKFFDGKNYICDTYHLQIEWNNTIPRVRELSSKITNTANKFKMQLVDLHMFPDATFCLASWQEYARSLKKEFNLKVLIHDYLIPYLFAQSYFSKYREWPWGQLSHSYFGLLEWLGRQQKYDKYDIARSAAFLISQAGLEKTKNILANRCRGHHPCICNSGLKNKDCHPDIKNGIALIRGELSRNIFSLEGLSYGVGVGVGVSVGAGADVGWTT